MLVSIAEEEEHADVAKIRVEARPASLPCAGRGLDLDDVCTQVGEHLYRGRPLQEMSKAQYLDAFEHCMVSGWHYASNDREMMMRWISEVPSTISSTFASPNARETGNSLMMPYPP